MRQIILSKLLFVILAFPVLCFAAQNNLAEEVQLIYANGYQVDEGPIFRDEHSSYYLLRSKETVPFHSVVYIPAVTHVRIDEHILPYRQILDPTGESSLERLDQSFVEYLGENVLSKLPYEGILQYRVIYFSRHASVSNDPFLLPYDVGGGVISLTLEQDPRGTWRALESLKDWRNSIEQNSVKDRLKREEFYAQKRVEIAVSEEIKKNRLMFEREQANRRLVIAQEDQSRYDSFPDKSAFIDTANWNDFFLASLLKKIYMQKEVHLRMVPPAKSFILAFLSKYANQCGYDESVAELGTISYISVKPILSSPASVLSFEVLDESLENDVPQAMLPVLRKYSKEIYTPTLNRILVDTQTTLEALLEGDPNLPIVGVGSEISNVIKAAFDTELWFSRFNCDSQYTQRMLGQIESIVAPEHQRNTEHVVNSSLTDSAVKQDSDKSAADFHPKSVYQSCAYFYGYTPSKMSWCRCVDRRLSQSLIISEELSLESHYEKFSKDFKSLLVLGDIEPHNSGASRLKIDAYSALDKCERKVM